MDHLMAQRPILGKVWSWCGLVEASHQMDGLIYGIIYGTRAILVKEWWSQAKGESNQGLVFLGNGWS